MENKNTELPNPTKLTEKKIYETYCDHYDSIHYLFIEFQFNWLQQAYKAMGDLDKYNILVYLYKENFVELSEIFRVKSLNSSLYQSTFGYMFGSSPLSVPYIFEIEYIKGADSSLVLVALLKSCM